VMNPDEEMLPLEEVEAVRGTTMEEGVKLHNKPLWQQIKDVLFVDEKRRFVLAIIRGDYSVNEVKLKKAVDALELRPATDEEIRDTLHSEPGFISPVKIKEGAKKGTEIFIVADISLRGVKNAYGGANKKNSDLFNMNIDRDYTPDLETDIASPPADCETEDGKELIEGKGIEVGNIFQLGTHYSTKMARAVFVDNDGKAKPYYMGCYGIGIGRTMGTVVEVHHDEKGMIWPKAIAPYQVHLVTIGDVQKDADKLYESLLAVGIEVLYDDRDERAGVKLNDADLIGIPLRLVLSDRTLKNQAVEWKGRAESEAKEVKLSDVEKAIMDFYE